MKIFKRSASVWRTIAIRCLMAIGLMTGITQANWHRVALADAPATHPALSVSHDTVAAADDFDLLIVDQETNEPIRGAQVQAGMRTFRGKTGADGHIKIPTSYRSWYNSFKVYAKAQGYVGKQLLWWQEHPRYTGTVPATYTLKMEHSTTIGGTVLDDQGKPLAGALVYAVFESKFVDPHEEYNVAGLDVSTASKTSSDGKWKYTGVPKDQKTIGFGVWDTMHLLDDRFSTRPVEDPAALYDGSMQFKLPKCTTVVFTIKDQAGGIVPGAQVTVGSYRPPYSVKPLESDMEGKFIVGILPGKFIDLTIEANGFKKRAFQETASETMQDHEETIELTPAK